MHLNMMCHADRNRTFNALGKLVRHYVRHMDVRLTAQVTLMFVLPKRMKTQTLLDLLVSTALRQNENH